MVAVGLHGLGNFLLVHIGSVAQLCYRGMALELLFETVDFVTDFIERTHLIEWQTHDATLLGNSLKNALANPPYCVRDELETTGLVKLLCGLNQTNVTLVNQISQRQTLMLILLGYRHYKS